MAVNNKTLNQMLYDQLYGVGFNPVSLNTKGQPTEDAKEADVFRFTAKDKQGKQIGTGWFTIDNGKLTLFADKDFVKSPNIEEFTTFMKNWAQHKRLKWEIKNRQDLVPQMTKRKVMKEKEQLGEGYYPMGKKASYNDSVPQVKIIIQHTRQIEEGEQRFRNIEKIFVENVNGEKFLLPTKRPGLARVYARHVAEGGTPYDDKGKHITSLVEEYTKMAGFVRATKNGQFNESASRLVNEATSHYHNLRETLTRMTSHRGYNKYFESYTPVLNEESEDDISLNELFVQETLDPRIESVMPILKRLSKNITEMSEVNELAEWAESVTEETVNEGWQSYYRDWLDSDFAPENEDEQEELIEKAKMYIDDATLFKKSEDWIENMALNFVNKYLDDSFYSMNEMDQTTKTLAIPADKMLEGLDDLKDSLNNAVMRRIMSQHPKLLKDLDNLEMAIDDAVSWFVGDGVEEVGSSDISAIVKDVAQRMEERHADINEAPGAETLAHNQSTEKSNLKAFDLDEGDMEEGIKNVMKSVRKKFRQSAIGRARQYGYSIEEGFSPSEEVADQIVDSLGGESNLTSDDVYRAVEEYQGMMDSPYKLDTDEVVQIVMDRLNITDEVGEGLDANQKRAGQLGPTEPVGKNEKNLRGKLVGASESVELDTLKTLSGIK